jgi:formylglycine-generating enzyme required for sulfatase activity/actin-like ATPase involved in cell morphogenesis
MSTPQPIGIDFGTTKTLVCRWDERRQQPVEIRLGRLGPMPTSIHVDSSGKPDLFGDDADDNQVFDPAGYVSRVKRYLGRKAPLVLHGKPSDPVSLVSEFLRHVRSRIEEEALHGPVGYTVITVPALFGPAAKASLKQAAETAGFSNFELLDEPVAGGLAFLHDSPATVQGQNFLVFDWGGGTLDLAVVRRDGENLLEVPNLLGGDIALGGEDIDDSIVERVSAMLTSQGRPSLEEQQEKHLTHARRALTAGKELLSRKQDHTFRFELGDGPLAFAWDRAQFEAVIEASVERAVFQTKRLVDKAVAASVALDGIILIGGSSKFPMIERRLAEVTGIKILKYDHSQEAVARGAALRAHARVSQTDAVTSSEGNRPPLVPPEYRTESVRTDSNPPLSPTPPKAPDADARAAATPASTVASATPEATSYAEAVSMAATPAITVASATKENPFVNSLGMKFVPVPISGGPSRGKRVLFNVWETRVSDYDTYAREEGITFEKPGFLQGPTHPVVNVSWGDAKKFCMWLTKRDRETGGIGPKEEYRLPSDHEWSCAVGIGQYENPNASPSEKDGKIPTAYPWGIGFPPPEGAGNYNNRGTMPVGSFTASMHGLFDLGGNVWEFCEELYGGASASRVSRGGSYVAQIGRNGCSSSYRNVFPPTLRSETSGFRVVLSEVSGVPLDTYVPETNVTPSRPPPINVQPGATPSAGSGKYCPVCKENVIPVFSTGMSIGTKIEAAVATAAAIIAAPFLIAINPLAIFAFPVAASQEIKKLKNAPKATRYNCPKCGHKL